MAAIEDDNGWTHLKNTNYPDNSDDNPDCQPPAGQGCRAWSDNISGAAGGHHATVSYSVQSNLAALFHDEAANTIANYLNTMGSGVASTHSPRFWLSSKTTGKRIGVVTVPFELKVCGGNVTNVDPAPPNHNHGCCQQDAITDGNVYLNYTQGVTYNNQGRIELTSTTNKCEIRNTFNHEFSHAIGLGHTKDQTQTMYKDPRPVYKAGTHDKEGVSCIYDLQNCG